MGLIVEVQAVIANTAKSSLLFCSQCESQTLHTRAALILPFHCVVSHGGLTKCHGCQTYVKTIHRMVLTGQWDYELYCDLCCSPDSPQKQEQLQFRHQQNIIDDLKPIDPGEPISLARALGASSVSELR